MILSVSQESPDSADALRLLDQLSKTLAGITGNDGTASFDSEDLENPRSIFVIGRNEKGEAVACGVIRPLGETLGEVKRIYSKEKGGGSQILKYLENKAIELNYKELWLETRRVNEYAVNFYLQNGFQPIPNYGKYIGRPEAICLGKILIK